MNLPEPVSCRVVPERGVLENASSRYVKALADLDGIYRDSRAFSEALERWGDTPVYEVTDFRPNTNAGDLIFGVTRMAPGDIGGEFFLTRGHIHSKSDRSEIYVGQRGHGVMLMESLSGEVRTVEITPQSVCYVPPHWIHRSVNVGSDELVMMFCYPADAGQDYGVIAETGGMRKRVISDGAGGWKFVDNEAYRPRHGVRAPAD